jgi:phage-related protein
MGILTELAAAVGQAFRTVTDAVHDALDEKLMAFRTSVMNVLCSAIFVLAGVLMAVVGLTFVVWGIYSLLAESMKPGAAAIVAGVGVFALAAIFTALAKARA